MEETSGSLLARIFIQSTSTDSKSPTHVFARNTSKNQEQHTTRHSVTQLLQHFVISRFMAVTLYYFTATIPSLSHKHRTRDWYLHLWRQSIQERPVAVPGLRVAEHYRLVLSSVTSFLKSYPSTWGLQTRLPEHMRRIPAKYCSIPAKYCSNLSQVLQ